MYEFKVSDLAEEFGVHRNTIRNWIASGTLSAKRAPGRKYSIRWKDYQALCEKFGRQPTVWPESDIENETSEAPEVLASPQRLVLLGSRENVLYDTADGVALCFNCGTCACACPISGVDGMDPRKLVRMAILNLNNELLDSSWIWKCTLCAKCEEACPMDVKISGLVRRLRSRCDRDKVPGAIHQGVMTCLEWGNNLGIPKEDYLALLESLTEEMVQEGHQGFRVPVDARGARLMVTVNSKEPYVEPDNLKHWWRIFHAAGESWTLASNNWDGSNWALFSGDDEAMKTIVGRIVDNVRSLNCQALLLPECGHAYFATRYGLNKWYPEALEEFKIYTLFDLLLEYIEAGRIALNPDLHPMLTTYHDPCHYGRKSLAAFGHGYFEEGRAITRQCCPNMVELEPNREYSYCCGAGGGIWSMPFEAERVYHGRMKALQIRESNARLVVAPCHNCRDQLFKSLNREFALNVEVKYLWELVADSLITGGKRNDG